MMHKIFWTTLLSTLFCVSTLAQEGGAVSGGAFEDLRKKLDGRPLSTDEIRELLKENGRVLKQNLILPIIWYAIPSEIEEDNPRLLFKTIIANKTSLESNIIYGQYIEGECPGNKGLCTNLITNSNLSPTIFFDIENITSGRGISIEHLAGMLLHEYSHQYNGPYADHFEDGDPRNYALATYFTRFVMDEKHNGAKFSIKNEGLIFNFNEYEVSDDGLFKYTQGYAEKAPTVKVDDRFKNKIMLMGVYLISRLPYYACDLRKTFSEACYERDEKVRIANNSIDYNNSTLRGLLKSSISTFCKLNGFKRAIHYDTVKLESKKSELYGHLTLLVETLTESFSAKFARTRMQPSGSVFYVKNITCANHSAQQPPPLQPLKDMLKRYLE